MKVFWYALAVAWLVLGVWFGKTDFAVLAALATLIMGKLEMIEANGTRR